MYWRKVKTLLKKKGIMQISKIDNDLPIYNERGKKKILELIDGLNDVKHTVDEFYSSKNFYERKLEMLLSNMF